MTEPSLTAIQSCACSSVPSTPSVVLSTAWIRLRVEAQPGRPVLPPSAWSAGLPPALKRRAILGLSLRDGEGRGEFQLPPPRRFGFSPRADWNPAPPHFPLWPLPNPSSEFRTGFQTVARVRPSGRHPASNAPHNSSPRRLRRGLGLVAAPRSFFASSSIAVGRSHEPANLRQVPAL